jgi:calcineurin-like phosphoesterase family protein
VQDLGRFYRFEGYRDMTVWFTSDSHFGHANIIKHTNRPFTSVASMDAHMIAQWNGVVRPTKDEVWHLGDFAFRSTENPGEYLSRLNGIKRLVHGNHDSDEVKKLPGWASSQPMAEIKVNGIRIVLLHYAMKVWNASHHGSLHFYGHSHGNLPGDRQSCDVGVDAWDFRPVRLEEIQERLLTLPERGGRQS